jgi:hypothetical protein
MPAEAGSIIFYDQKFAGMALPEVGDVSEETRLRAAVVGVYELWFRQQPQYEFSGALLLHDKGPNPQRCEQQKQFEVSEEITGIKRTLMIRRTAVDINLDAVEIIPLDWRENPLEFIERDVSERQRIISYAKEPPTESLKLKFSGLNVFDVESINATLWTNARNYSPEKMTAFIRRSEDIRIDRLDNSQGGARRIEEYLLTLFGVLLEKAPDRTFDFECSYRYQVVDGGPDAFLPVAFQKSLSLPTASELFSSLLPVLNNWYQNFSPPEGVFDFGVKVYGAASENSVPVIHLTGLVLPIESIAGWNDAPAN